MQLISSRLLNIFLYTLLFVLFILFFISCQTRLNKTRYGSYLPSVIQNALVSTLDDSSHFSENQTTIPLTESEIIEYCKNLKSGFTLNSEENADKQKKEFIEKYFLPLLSSFHSNLDWIEKVYNKNIELKSNVHFPYFPSDYVNIDLSNKEKLFYFVKMSKLEAERIKEDKDWDLLIDNLEVTWKWIEKFYTKNYIPEVERNYREKIDGYYKRFSNYLEFLRLEYNGYLTNLKRLELSADIILQASIKPSIILIKTNEVSEKLKLNYSKEDIINWVNSFNKDTFGRLSDKEKLIGAVATLDFLEFLLPKLKKKENSISNLIPIFEKIYRGKQIEPYQYAILTDFFSSDFSSFIRKMDKERSDHDPFKWMSEISKKFESKMKEN